MNRGDWIEDKLGWYRVSTVTRNKPTTINYWMGCPECNALIITSGSPTTRKKTLYDGLICPICESFVNGFKLDPREYVKTHK
jgi:hypothetical protein